MSKAEVNRISLLFCQAGKVCTNTSLRDREERRALWGKEPEKVEASSHEKASTVRSLLPDSWVYRKIPAQVFGWKTPKTHRKHYAKDKTQGLEWWPTSAKRGPLSEIQNINVAEKCNRITLHINQESKFPSFAANWYQMYEDQPTTAELPLSQP